MTALILIVLFGLVIWGVWARWQFFTSGSRSARPAEPPDLRNFAPPAEPEGHSAPTSPPPKQP
jgi:hypothetical protein